MSSKLEKIIGWIGVGLSAIYTFFMLLIVISLYIPQTKKEIINQFKEQNQSISVDQITFVCSYILVGLLFSTIFALIALLIIKQKRVLSSMLLIAMALVGLFTYNWIAAILWLISGILLITRHHRNKRHSDRFNRYHFEAPERR
ncbi:DUF4064 domain-containing protein [Staphylococcus sp. SQ8-PEA]|uniref:DUF4064 domain-containing protein n=1 Tax=Staphylococcus marylandisciuri TaxID=2981529 RepID=A0ABT2QNX4_9STAP|nr:DUF4064 domain-containing protein [Staphylococcus marylandisciuri]MCU5745655.1 DUF4064 domain-containing protein [Staphylococcus marylandisciuri]